VWIDGAVQVVEALVTVPNIAKLLTRKYSISHQAKRRNERKT
jgi:hypothetical protein